MNKIILAKSNVFYLTWFLLGVLILAFLSLTIKFILLWNASSFTTHSFNVLVIEHDAHVLHIDRDTHELVFLTYRDSGNNVSGKSKFEAGFLLGIPIDAIVEYQNAPYTNIETDFLTAKTSAKSLFNALRPSYIDMNSADILRMYLAHRAIPLDNTKHFFVNQKMLGTSSREFIDEVRDGFRDEGIFNEQKSIEIINATEISGLGSRVSQVLENAGYNVISLKNGNQTSSQIIDRTGEKTNTLLYLERFFEFPVKRESSVPVADITVILGKDLTQKTK